MKTSNTKITLINKIVLLWIAGLDFEPTKSDITFITNSLKAFSNNLLKKFLKGHVSRNLPLEVLMLEIGFSQKKPSAIGKGKLPPGLAYASLQPSVDSDQAYLDDTSDDNHLSDEHVHDGSKVVIIEDEEKFNAWQKKQAALEAKRIAALPIFKLASKFTAAIPTLEYYSKLVGGGLDMGFDFRWGSLAPPKREEFINIADYKEAMEEYWTHEDSDIVLPHEITVSFKNQEREEIVHFFLENKLAKRAQDLRAPRMLNGKIYDPVEIAKARRDGTFKDWTLLGQAEKAPITYIYPKGVKTTVVYQYMKGLRTMAKYPKLVCGTEPRRPTYINNKGVCVEMPATKDHDPFKPFNVDEYIKDNPVSTVHYHEPKDRTFTSDVRKDDKAYRGFDNGHLINYAQLDVADMVLSNDFISDDPSNVLENLEQNEGYNIYLGE